jgi:protein-S-isoprenylcysteine O-methyltransferase Ste14
MKMTNAERDIPGVIVLPPLIPLAALLLGLLLDWLVPGYFLHVFLTFGERIFLGIILFAVGLALILVGGHYFSVAKTNIPPYKPALHLVTDGIYAWVRNPMYVGFGFITAGLAIAFGSDWTLVLMIPAAIVLHRGVVLREERYLEAKFGDAYRQYMMRVPRYGWPPRL